MKDRFARLREDFPLLKQKVHGHPLLYFDSAATAHKPESVIETISTFYRDQYSTVHRAVYSLAAEASVRYEEVRDQVQRFIKAKHREEIIFTRGTTDSINLVASAFGEKFVQKSDEIIITEMEHHSNLVPWQMLCEKKGAILRVVPVTDTGELDQEYFRSFLSSRTRLVAFTHLSNAIGTINPVREMIKTAHIYGAAVLVDGAQSTPHLPIDVSDLDVDFFAFSGHKLFGPNGIGILYGKKQWLEEMPPYQGGGDMIREVFLDRTIYQPPPLRFEAGTPMIAEVIGLGAALSYVSAIPSTERMLWESQLTQRALEGLKKIPKVRLIGQPQQRGTIISFAVEGIHPLDLGTLLDLHGVAVRTGHHCTQPLMRRYGLPGTVRLSLAFYNTEEEVDRFLNILETTIYTLTQLSN